MKQIVFILFAWAFVVLGCEKGKDENKYEDILIGRKWILVDKSNVDGSISITFYKDKTFIITSFIETPLPSVLVDLGVNSKTSLIITGNWTQKGNEITFFNESIFNESIDLGLSDTPVEIGKPIGLHENGSIKFVDIQNNDSNFVLFDGNTQHKWTIIEVIKDKLVVNSDGKMITYRRE